MRVGRAALDEDAIRLIEEHNPDVEFDWTQILKGQDAPAAPPRPAIPQPAPRAQMRRERPRTPESSRPAPRPEAEPREDVAEPLEPALPVLFSAGLDEEDATLTVGEPVPAGGLDDLEEMPGPLTAAGARLGSEALLRLRARYAEVLARISERVSDPVRQEQLKSQAERLNPDTWVTDRDVQEGLEQYEATFDSLRSVIGRKRSRRRRRRSGQTPGVALEQAAAPDGGLSDEPEQPVAGNDDGDER